MTQRKPLHIKFYQFWLNASDDDAAEYIRKFTLLTKEEINDVTLKHTEAPHLRTLQKLLARDITIRVHSEEEYLSAVEASEILFGKGTTETLKKLSKDTLLSVFEGVPRCEVVKDRDSKKDQHCRLPCREYQIYFHPKEKPGECLKKVAWLLIKEGLGNT